jgi:cell division septation protein DedD
MQKAYGSEDVGQTRRLALHMAVLSQVHIAFHQYRAVRSELLQTVNMRDTQNRLLEHVAKRADHELDSQLTFVSDAIDTTISRINLFQTYANFQNAKGRLLTTLGLDQGYNAAQDSDLSKLSLDLRTISKLWQQIYHVQHSNVETQRVTAPIDFAVPVQLEPVEIPENIASNKNLIPATTATPQAVVLKTVADSIEESDVVVAAMYDKLADPYVEEAVEPAKIRKDRVETKVPEVELEPVREKISSVNLAQFVAAANFNQDSADATTKTVQTVVETVETSGFRYAVQVAGFDNERQSVELVAKLREKGYDPFVNRTQSDGRSWRFVWIERFRGYKKALAAQQAYQERENSAAFVTPIKRTKQVDHSPDKLIEPAPELQTIISSTANAYRYAVQVAEYTSQWQTDNLVSELKEKGYNPYVKLTTGVDGSLWRFVWIGRFWSGQEAQAVSDAYKINEKKPAFLTNIQKNQQTTLLKKSDAVDPS